MSQRHMRPAPFVVAALLAIGLATGGCGNPNAGKAAGKAAGGVGATGTGGCLAKSPSC